MVQLSRTEAVVKATSPSRVAKRAKLRERFEQAVETLRVMRLSATDKPASVRSAWPEIVRTAAEVFAAEVDATPQQRKDMHADRLRVRVSPSSADISKMDEALKWLLWIDGDARKVVFALALGIPAPDLACRMGVSVATVWRRQRHGFDTIAAKLIDTVDTV